MLSIFNHLNIQFLVNCLYCPIAIHTWEKLELLAFTPCYGSWCLICKEDINSAVWQASKWEDVSWESLLFGVKVERIGLTICPDSWVTQSHLMCDPTAGVGLKVAGISQSVISLFVRLNSFSPLGWGCGSSLSALYISYYKFTWNSFREDLQSGTASLICLKFFRNTWHRSHDSIAS